MQLLIFVLLLFIQDGVYSTTVNYTGYKVIKFTLANEDQLNYIAGIQKHNGFIQEEHPLFVGSKATIAIPPSRVSDVINESSRLGIEMGIVYEDLQEIIDIEKATVDRRTPDNDFDFDVYHTFEAIVDQLRWFVNNCPSNLSCQLYNYGSSYEGRGIWAVKIGKQGVANDNVYWMQGVTHAREWLSTATILKVMDKFWSGYGTDDEVTQLLTDQDWYFSPVTNPDGYEYSHTTDRLQRKNRGPNEDSTCLGTDINRNYDSQWGTEGVSHDPCNAEVYCGDHAASEWETQAIQAEIRKITGVRNMRAFLDVHTFGQYILMPFGYQDDDNNCVHAEHHSDLLQVANAFADAIENTYGTTWTRGSTCDVLYTLSGGSIDWTLEATGIKYAFTPELRGQYFTANPDQIEPSFQEFYNGILAMVDEIAIIDG